MKSEFNKNFISLISGTGIAQAIPILIAPIISRIYSPQEFGFFSLYISIAGILAVISTMKFEMAIILPKNKIIVYQLIQTCIFIALIFSIIAFLIIAIFIVFYQLNLIYITLPITSFLISFISIFDRYYNREKKYFKMSAQRIVKTTTESVFNILGIFSLFRSYNLVLGYIIGFLLSSIYIIKSDFISLKKSLFSISFKKIKWSILKYKKFPLYTLPHSFINTLSASIPIILIPYYFDQTTLGNYTFGLKYIQAPLALISNATYNLLSQEFSDIISDKLLLIKKFNSVLKKLTLLSIIILPILIFAKPLFCIIFGANWSISGEYIQLLSVWILLSFIISSFAIIPILFNQQNKALQIEILYSLAKIIPFVLFAGIFKSSIQTVLIAYSVLTCIILIYSFHWYSKLIKE